MSNGVFYTPLFSTSCEDYDLDPYCIANIGKLRVVLHLLSASLGFTASTYTTLHLIQMFPLRLNIGDFYFLLKKFSIMRSLHLLPGSV